ncbi:aspartate-semialdehyde dehydrogenase [Calidifontibacter sp. DB0510]|uniref:Aspartate-semialdehyde dehydrogenase n=1 Tax=Metallococcus carri TaxID=1656884 RepID=A0A967B0Z1_9MICO|nr:aspartate-semialdehyde dehydrogenase [Metallococcus carri]NHN56789.1 aspartate-semialdehyde dehydrogenase [Metallococcus carri]NOP37834.1 aspartate-semialdehyde dehydrogenase [Calidifontibacter sp. DB2511S]
MASSRPVLAVVGATGVVGQVLRSMLPTRASLWSEVRLIASDRSAGQSADLFGDGGVILPLARENFVGVDVAVFAVPAPVAAEWVPLAATTGARVIDNSGASSALPGVPLVAPDINPDALSGAPIVAGAGASTLMMVGALRTLHENWRLTEVIATTLQAVSDAGVGGVHRLYDEATQLAGNRAVGQRPGDVRRYLSDLEGESPFPAPVAFNVIPWVGDEGDGRWSGSELRVRDEVRTLLELPELRMTTTCVQVPVVTTHSVSMHLTFERRIHREDAVRALTEASNGVVLLDDPLHDEWPTPADVVGADPVFVGRVRQPADFPHSLELFLCCDNLRRGSALTLLHLAELAAQA